MSHFTPLRETIGAAAASRLGAGEPVIREIATQLYAGRWTIAGSTLICGALAALYLVTATKEYTATTSLQIEVKETALLDIEGLLAGAASDAIEIGNEIELLRSPRIVGRVVDKLDMTRDPEFNAELEGGSVVGVVVDGVKAVIGLVTCPSVGALCGEPVLPTDPTGLYSYEAFDPVKAAVVAAVQERTVVEPIEGTFHVAVAFTSEDPRKAALVADAIASEFFADKLEAKRRTLDDAIAYLDRQSVELQQKLEATGRELETFRTDEGVILGAKSAIDRTIEDQVLTATNARLIEARDRRETAQRERDALAAQIEAARGALDAGDYGLAAEALASQLVQTLFVENREIRRRAEAGEGDAKRRLEASTAELEAAIRGQIERRESGLQSFAVRLNSLDEIVRMLEADAAQQSQKSVRAQRLSQEVEATRATYQTVLLRLRELSVERALQTEGGRVTGAATPPEKASAPKKALVMALGLFAGLAIGLGWTILGEQLSRGLRTKGELARVTGVAVLGAVPIIKARSISRAYLRELGRSAGSRVGEAMRGLRTMVTLQNAGTGQAQVIAVTSSVASEGKSTTTLLLASVLATANRRVVVVDCDLRNPTLKRLLPTRSPLGLRALLTGAATLEDVLTKRADLDFEMIVSENGAENAADLLATPEFARLIATLKSSYDVVLLDCPPVLPVADAPIVGRIADGVLFAVKWNATGERVVEQAIGVLREVGAPILGAFYAQVDEADYARFEFGATGDYRRTTAKYYGS